MYNVAFVYTAAAGGYEGVRTWTSFPSKEHFDKWYTEDIKKREKVVEEGVTPERCVELIRETPQACRVAAALQESTCDGVVDSGHLLMKLAQIELVKVFEKLEGEQRPSGAPV